VTAIGALNALPAPRLAMLPDAQQVEMFRNADGTLPKGVINEARRRGRPPGATNKRNKRIADYFVSKWGDPLDVLGNLINTPLRTLVDYLIEADGGAEREEKLLEMVEEATAHIKSLRTIAGDAADKREMAAQLADAIDKLASAAAKISGKPGKLALDALALQIQATFRATEYVHGKQPIAIDIRKQADVVVVAPEILREHNIDPQELASAIAEHGLEALDADSMRLIGVRDGEFSEVGDGADESDGQ
jgi:hypothetical protein